MTRFVDRLNDHGSALAIVGADGLRLTYRELSQRVDALCDRLAIRGGLLVIESENEVEALIGYLAALRSHNPVMLTPPGRADMIATIRAKYAPQWLYARTERGWQLETCEGSAQPAPHPDLAVLLSTSGSTGASKFVRLSHLNLDANARSIIEYLSIVPDDCAATTLPFNYSYGLSVLNTHLMAGATLMVTNDSVLDDSFWADFERHGVTSFAAVPYTFELLDRVDFEHKRLPTLRYITQSGAKLSPDSAARYHAIGQRMGWQLFLMYGQTEATTRMAYLPPQLVASHPGAVGIAIPGGEFHLIDERGRLVEGANEAGELIYRGPNVMMGYAEHRSDLLRGPELTELATGDLAERDDQGIYTLVGRKKRILKIYGLRISLDEVEARLEAEGVRGVATGVDESLVIATLDAGERERIRRSIAEWCRLPTSVVTVLEVDDYPRLAAGKIDYATLQASAAEAAPSTSSAQADQDIRSILRDGTGAEEILPTSTFVSLGGDSLSYISVSLALEEHLGFVPDRWERLTVAELEALEPRTATWTQIETSILLRGVAILAIVSNHFGAFDALGLDYPGGSAMLLLIVSGFNFANFQIPEAVREGAWPILRTLWRVALPTALFLLTVELVSGKFVPSTILMVSNFIGPNVNFGIEPWYIYVLIQIYAILALVFAVPAIRRAVGRAGYVSCLALLVVATLISLAGPALWNTDPLFNRVPHILLYGFMLGACIALGDSTRQKLFHSALLVAFFLTPRPFYTGVSLVGALVLVWTRHLWLAWPLNRAVGAIGSASLFIYLSHHNFAQYMVRLFGVDTILTNVAAGLLGGIVLWWGWEKALALTTATLHRWRSARA